MGKYFQCKVNKQGNRLSVEIPNEIAEKINLKKGDMLDVTINEEKNEFVCRKAMEIILPKGIDQDFLGVLDGVIGDYQDALYNLKDRI